MDMVPGRSLPGSPQLIVWDSSQEPRQNEGGVLLWAGHADRGSARSLLRYVEAHGERLRHKYLAWVHDMGEHVVGGKCLRDHLSLGNGLSYWWLTKIVEKSPHRSPLADALRLLALEEILTNECPRLLKYIGSDRRLHETLAGLCERMHIKYEWRADPSPGLETNGASAGKRGVRRLDALRALVRYCRTGWRLRRQGRPSWFQGDAALFVCGYFVNVVPEEADAGRFHSRYWEGLHDLLRASGRLVNWLHHNAAQEAATAVRWVRRFNEDPRHQGVHIFLDTYLSFGVVAHVCLQWLRLSWIRWRLGRMDEAFRPSGSHLSFWPLMEDDWNESLSGPLAVANLLAVGLFDAAMHDLPHQPQGLYLCENNAWERALVHAWRRHGHGQLIGVAHSTVCYWDLRHFSDGRDLDTRSSHALPRPDLVALNGPAAVSAYVAAQFPRCEIVLCEALRYAYLAHIDPVDSSGVGSGDSCSVLVISDFMPSFTSRMLTLLEQTAGLLPAGYSFSVKPHPVCPVEPRDYPGLPLKVVTQPLSEILGQFDVAFAGSTTSGAVDAWQAGLPVVVMLEEDQLNLSPLRGHPGVCFVTSPEELRAALSAHRRETAAHADTSGFFFLDQSLPRWQDILSSRTARRGLSSTTVSE